MLRATDSYTGRLLWQKNLPDLGAFHDITGHQPGAGEIGSNYVSLEDAVYVVHGDTILDLERLRVFEPRPHYVFAMKCAALAYEEGDGTTETVNDIRYLLRLLDLQDSDAAMSALAPYFTATQLPEDIRALLTDLAQ